MNDTTVWCQNASVTEPQREDVERSETGGSLRALRTLMFRRYAHLRAREMERYAFERCTLRVREMAHFVRERCTLRVRDMLRFAQREMHHTRESGCGCESRAGHGLGGKHE